MTAPPDLRLLLPGVAAWLGALGGFLLPWWAWAALVLAVAAPAVRVRSLVLVAVAVTLGLSGASAALRVAEQQHSLVAAAAAERGYVSAVVRLTADPVERDGRFGGYVVARGTTRSIEWRGQASPTRARVLLLGRGDWSHVGLGATVRASGRLAPADSVDLAGTLSVSSSPVVLDAPASMLQGAATARGWIREASSGASPSARELVPGLVVGDDGGLPEEVVEEFREAGLTHLTAVSGTNLTLVVGFLLILARWCGVRSRGLVLVGVLGVVGFVLLARPEPSVVRAAAMGSVALLGLGSGGRGRGVRALSVAVLVLLLLDPWLALSVGFALSATATAGILFLAPPMRDALAHWLPRWAAEAVAVPFAAQLACTPVVAAVSGSVSLVAVLANVLVAPVVGPATVLGLLGGLVWPISPLLGGAMGHVAGWCADWIIHVADRAAALPGASMSWAPGAISLAALSLLCVLVAWAAPLYLAGARRTLIGALALVIGMVQPLPLLGPLLGWPPDGWVMVACDVGQGDAVVLNSGAGAGVVIDAGPDPGAIDRCLRRLGIDRVPVVVLTHFHADHIDGLPGVLRDRDVGEVLVTGVRDPPHGADQVDQDTAGVPVRVPAYGEVAKVGAVTWQVIGPVGGGGTDHGEEGSAANNASLVLLVEVRGVSMLLTGDAEPEAQAALARSLGVLSVDVLKVPHHGSRYQDMDFLAGLGARLALVSVGADNDYGHPSPVTIDGLRRTGMQVRRTDLDGDLAVLVKDDELRVSTSR